MGFQVNARTALPYAIRWLKGELRALPEIRRAMKDWEAQRDRVIASNSKITPSVAHTRLPEPPYDPYRFSEKRGTLLGLLQAEINGRNHIRPDVCVDERILAYNLLGKVGMEASCVKISQGELLKKWITSIDRMDKMWNPPPAEKPIPLGVRKKLILSRTEIQYVISLIEHADKLNAYRKKKRRDRQLQLVRKSMKNL